MTREIKDLAEIRGNYAGFLFDAYGVLVDDQHMLPGAREVWMGLQQLGFPTWIVTNGSSRTLEAAVEAYRQMGLIVRPEQLINSASLLKSYFQEHSLQGKRTAVLGTSGSKTYVREAQGLLVDPLKDDFDVLVVANQSDYDFIPTLDSVLSCALRAIENGRDLRLILTNPDVIYPKHQGEFGLTAGAVALMIEAGLKARLGAEAPTFDKLGKPYPRIFAEAVARAGTRRLLMIGDQLETDIRGAENFGIDSLLLGTGLTDLKRWAWRAGEPKPTYTLSSWS